MEMNVAEEIIPSMATKSFVSSPKWASSLYIRNNMEAWLALQDVNAENR